MNIQAKQKNLDCGCQHSKSPKRVPQIPFITVCSRSGNPQYEGITELPTHLMHKNKVIAMMLPIRGLFWIYPWMMHHQPFEFASVTISIIHLEHCDIHERTKHIQSLGAF